MLSNSHKSLFWIFNWIRQGGSLLSRRYVNFLASKGLVNKNFNYLFFLFKFYFGKRNSFFGEVSPDSCQNSFLDSPIFFPHKTPFPKSIYKVFGKKDAETYSELSQTSVKHRTFCINNDFKLLTICAKSLHVKCSTRSYSLTDITSS